MNPYFALYHVSEQSDIAVFTPRPVQNRTAWPDLPPVVWAVSGEMLHNYLFPRDCPRVCRMLGPQTTPAEIARFRDAGPYRAHIFVEEAWQERIETAVLTLYTFAPDHFYAVDFNAGYYVSVQEIYPLSHKTLHDLPQLLQNGGVRLEYTPDLARCQRENVQSGYRFSNIRMKNKNGPKPKNA
jgi:hypothetical protein